VGFAMSVGAFVFATVFAAMSGFAFVAARVPV